MDAPPMCDWVRSRMEAVKARLGDDHKGKSSSCFGVCYVCVWAHVYV
jgi:hypothetical protein